MSRSFIVSIFFMTVAVCAFFFSLGMAYHAAMDLEESLHALQAEVDDWAQERRK